MDAHNDPGRTGLTERQHAEYVRDWETTAVGLAEENERVATALAALWKWAVSHGIEHHAEDGDAIAVAIVDLVREATDA